MRHVGHHGTKYVSNMTPPTKKKKGGGRGRRYIICETLYFLTINIISGHLRSRIDFSRKFFILFDNT